MTTIDNHIPTNEYWNKMYYDSTRSIVESKKIFVHEDFDCYKRLIKHEMVDFNLSSPNEAEQHMMQICTSSNSPSESQTLKLVCGVCGAPAHGYNFDQITCESCKAFFRRNALRNTANIKCRYSGQCEINIHTRRQCTHCRLKKCFDIQMKKEWIRTETERELRRLKNVTKQQRKHQSLSSEQISLLQMPIVIRKKKRVNKLIGQQQDCQVVQINRMNIFAIHRDLSDDDRILMSNIYQAYSNAAEQVNYYHISRYTKTSSLSQFINDESVNHQSLIHFYKHVNEFRQFDLDDQILLVKCNLVGLIHLHHIITQNFQELPEMSEHMSSWLSHDFHIQMSQARKKFDCFMKYPLVLQITLIVFIFSCNLSLPRGCSQHMTYKNKKKLYENQNFYVTLLWKYLIYLFGNQEAIKLMSLIVMQILRYQTLMNIMDEFLRKNNAYQDIFNPLMQSVFGLT